MTARLLNLAGALALVAFCSGFPIAFLVIGLNR